MQRKLVVCEGPSRGKEHVLDSATPVTIGRSKGAVVQVDDPAVSRIHCEVVPQGEFWVVRDKASRNHVFVGKRQTEEHVLQDGDVFRLGRHTAILFRIHDQTREVETKQTVLNLDLDRTLAVEGRKAKAEGVSLVGQALGGYRVAERLGTLGAATCYRGLQPSLNRNVLLQVYSPNLSADVSFRDRLIAEVQRVSPLLHPNLQQLFELEEEGGRLFLVLEHFKGTSLADHLAKQSFVPIKKAIEVTVRLCDAVSYAAEQQCVLGSIDPADVLIDDSYTPKLRVLRDPSSADSAERDLASLPPEALTPSGRPDIRGAVYSLGAILYRCVGGMPPFQGSDPDALKAKILKEPPRDLRKLNIRVSEELGRVVAKALEKQPAARQLSPAELAEDLGRILRGR
jgi:serine/threonine protein kinase